MDYEDLNIRYSSWYYKEFIQKVLPFCTEKVNSNTNLDHSRSIDRNLKNLLCQLNNLYEIDANDN